jgi:hypothetical protein
MSEIKKVFNYDTINETHKEAAQEIVDVLKSMGSEIQAELVSKKFKLVEPITYKLSESSMVTMLEKHGLPVMIQGFTLENDMQYQIVGVMGDIRLWNSFFEKYIKNESNKISE